MADFEPYRKALTIRVLDGEGKAASALRRAAFENKDVTPAMRTLLDKVTKHAYKVLDEDIAAVKAAGASEDEIFELVICAAVGQATRQYESALAALEEAEKK